jgi:hypothetical protein
MVQGLKPSFYGGLKSRLKPRPTKLIYEMACGDRALIERECLP